MRQLKKSSPRKKRKSVKKLQIIFLTKDLMNLPKLHQKCGKLQQQQKYLI